LITPLVLILEDQPDIRRLLKIFVSRFPVRIIEAESIAQASLLVEQNGFDLVFLDYMLPDGLGIDVCRKIRSGGGFTQIVMVTARGEAQVSEDLLAAGASQIIIKPFEPAAVSDIMQAFTRSFAQRQAPA
jgi:DNA-binding response OmpR family regulator